MDVNPNQTNILFLKFSEDYSRFYVGHRKGFGIFSLIPYKQIFQHQNNNGIIFVDSNPKNKYIAFVEKNNPCMLNYTCENSESLKHSHFIDDIKIRMLTFPQKISNIKLSRNFMIIFQSNDDDEKENTILLYPYKNLEKTQETYYNPPEYQVLIPHFSISKLYTKFYSGLSQLAIIQQEKSITMFDLSDLIKIKEMPKVEFDFPEKISVFTLSPNGMFLAACDVNGRNILVYSFVKGCIVKKFCRGTTKSRITNISFHPRSSMVLCHSNHDTIHVFLLQTEFTISGNSFDVRNVNTNGLSGTLWNALYLGQYSKVEWAYEKISKRYSKNDGSKKTEKSIVGFLDLSSVGVECLYFYVVNICFDGRLKKTKFAVVKKNGKKSIVNCHGIRNFFVPKSEKMIILSIRKLKMLDKGKIYNVQVVLGGTDVFESTNFHEGRKWLNGVTFIEDIILPVDFSSLEVDSMDKAVVMLVLIVRNKKNPNDFKRIKVKINHGIEVLSQIMKKTIFYLLPKMKDPSEKKGNGKDFVLDSEVCLFNNYQKNIKIIGESIVLDCNIKIRNFGFSEESFQEHYQVFHIRKFLTDPNFKIPLQHVFSFFNGSFVIKNLLLVSKYFHSVISSNICLSDIYCKTFDDLSDRYKYSSIIIQEINFDSIDFFNYQSLLKNITKFVYYETKTTKRFWIDTMYSVINILKNLRELVCYGCSVDKKISRSVALKENKELRILKIGDYGRFNEKNTKDIITPNHIENLFLRCLNLSAICLKCKPHNEKIFHICKKKTVVEMEKKFKSFFFVEGLEKENKMTEIKIDFKGETPELFKSFLESSTPNNVDVLFSEFFIDKRKRFFWRIVFVNESMQLSLIYPENIVAKISYVLKIGVKKQIISNFVPVGCGIKIYVSLNSVNFQQFGCLLRMRVDAELSQSEYEKQKLIKQEKFCQNNPSQKHTKKENIVEMKSKMHHSSIFL